jgi:hypothetical protein
VSTENKHLAVVRHDGINDTSAVHLRQLRLGFSTKPSLP